LLNFKKSLQLVQDLYCIIGPNTNIQIDFDPEDAQALGDAADDLAEINTVREHYVDVGWVA
jgi:hypothetical protein